MEFVDCVIDEGENIEKLWTVFRGDEFETMLNVWEERVRDCKQSKKLLWGIMEGCLIVGGEDKVKKVCEMLELVKETDFKRAIHMSFKIV